MGESMCYSGFGLCLKDFQYDTGSISCLDFSQILFFHPSNGTDIPLEGDQGVQAGFLQL